MSIAITAAKLLKDNGEPVEFRYEYGGAYDPSVGGIVGGVSGSISANGYAGNYSSAELNGTAIESGDVRLICESLSTRPETGWLCEVDGSEYRVMAVQPIRKSGSDIIYICQLRK